ncbi:DNA-binding protein [Pseudanabaena minima]|uniref:DNA-binding protein n=1 Tax=Pseudanabaena minima TaxID=890415 RepID=UPI003DA9C879
MSKTASQSTYKASVDYHSSHIARLQDPEYAAVYLDVHLEDHEPSDIETNLLKLALGNVAEALVPEQLTAYSATLEAIMQKQGTEAIYGLADWLKGLGLKLTVTVDAAEARSKDLDQDLEELEIAA